MKNKFISIIVPCYNSEKTIENCIDAIDESIKYSDNKIAVELCIVDDGSTDQTYKIVQNYKHIKLSQHKKNKGLACARNTGINATKGEYIIFLDSDIFIEKNWINTMLELIIENIDVIGITGQLSPLSADACSTLEYYLFSKYRGIQNINFNTPLNYKLFVFSNTIIKRSILNEIGLFDETLNKYGGEDTEIAIRINKKYPLGMRKLIKIRAYHIVNKTLNQYKHNMFEYGKYNFPKIINKHPDYRNDLGYKGVLSVWGYFLFNSITRFQITFFSKLFSHPLLTKFLIIDQFVQGARESLKK